MVQAAIAAGMTTIGFSSHSLLPGAASHTLAPEKANAYVQEVRALGERYRERIRVLLSFEVDYVPAVAGDSGGSYPDHAAYAQYQPDYLIGSVHYVTAPDGFRFETDNRPEILFDAIRDHFGGDERAFIRAYHELLRAMVAGHDFEIIGHLDLYRKYNAKHPFFDENAAWHVAELEKSAEVIAASGKIVEVNTGAIARGWRDDAYPADGFREMLRRRGVKFMLNSDAHSVAGIDAGYERYANAEEYVEL